VGPQEGESEDAFLKRLTAEMSEVMGKMGSGEEDVMKMGKELEEFTRRMEEQGVQPEDLLKAILGEEEGATVGQIAHAERDRRDSEKKSKSRSPEAARAAVSDDRPSSSASSKHQPNTSFEDTIRRTMARMSESSAAATSATTTQQQQKSEEALLADMLRALEGDGGDGESDGEMSKMFLGLMEQLTNKDMLYEPMKELSEKFPTYLKENDPSSPSPGTTTAGKDAKKAKLSQADFERFTRQEKIVQAIVAKFEEKGYSDNDPKSREFIWEKMQEMQAEGAPPEALLANPFPGMGGLMGGGGDGGPDEGCPTQ
jgi:peroxin-19